MFEDRREDLRRIEDVRELLRFCQKFGQSVPSKVVARLAELGIPGGDQRSIPELLEALDEVERPARQALVVDRRARRRRFLTAELDE